MRSPTTIAWQGRLEEIQTSLAKQITAAVREAGEDFLYDLRRQTIAGGLGERISNAWRMKMYPGTGYSLTASSMIFSKATKIHEAFSKTSVIKTKNGERFLAIPTENVPRKAGRQKMTPQEVEGWLNGDMDFVPFSNGRPGGLLVTHSKLVRSKNGKSWRAASKRRLSAGRNAENVVMFTLVPTATIKKRIDFEDLEAKTLNSLAHKLEGISDV